MKNIVIPIVILFITIVGYGQSRKIIGIPDVPGYVLLKCDFHMHTVFSDGSVWPTVRVQEAWAEGLDVISITEHIEYLPHSKDIDADHNRSYEIARPLADELGLILVRGAEITRAMPPGHLNTLFIKNANLLEREDVLDALREAREQGAFIFWNHPGWKSQQPDTMRWWDIHDELHEQDLMHGIEVFNTEFYPGALDWANDKELTVICNSDVHGPMIVENGHRDMTLVFAKGKKLRDIKEALFEGQTLAYFGNTLAGKEKLLEAVFFSSIEITGTPLQLKNRGSRKILIENRSDVNYELELVQPGVGFIAPESIRLEAHRITPVIIKGNSDEVAGMDKIYLYYEVKNMRTTSRDNLLVTLSIDN